MIMLLCLSLLHPPADSCPHEPLLQAFFKAYNAHDIDAMLSHVTDDIQWFSIMGDKIGVEAAGKDALRQGMTGYFKAIPSTRSELVSHHCGGSYVSTYEKAIWENKEGETKSQASMAVYAVKDGKISKVWYFPAE